MSRRFGLWLVAGVLALAAAPAHANHVAGATYRGTTAGGGTVEFDVSGDGAAITRFVAADVSGNCGTLARSFAGSVPIVNHAFSSDAADTIRFEGSFPASGQAAGRLLQSSCPNSPLSWTAATGAAVGAPQQPPADRTPPALETRARRSQPLRRRGAIRIRVRCPDEPCRVIARGSAKARGERRFRLKRAAAQLARGGAGARLVPRLGRRARAAARRALLNGRSVRVTITVIATDAAGNRTVRRLPIRPYLRR